MKCYALINNGIIVRCVHYIEGDHPDEKKIRYENLNRLLRGFISHSRISSKETLYKYYDNGEGNKEEINFLLSLIDGPEVYDERLDRFFQAINNYKLKVRSQIFDVETFEE